MTHLSTVAAALRQNRDDRAVRTAAGLIGSQILIAVASLAVNLLSARVLGPAGRGELALYTQLAIVAGVFCVLGVEQAYPAALTVRPTVQQAGTEVWRLIRWPTLLVTAAVAGGIVIANGATGAGWLLCVGFVLYSTMLALLAVLSAASAAASSARRQLAVVTVWQLTLLPVGGLLAALGVRSAGIWLCLLGATGLVPLVVVLFGFRSEQQPAERSGQDLHRARTLGLRLLPATITNLLLVRAERFLIPWLASLPELGIYIVVATLTELVDLPMRYLLRAKTPDLADQIRAGRLRHRRILLLGLGYGVGGGLTVGVVAGAVLVPFFGAEYADGIDLALPLGLAAGMYSFSRVGATICVAAHIARPNTLMDLLGLVTLVIGCLILVPRYGAAGATVATLAAYCLVAALSLWCVRVAVRQTRPRGDQGGPTRPSPDDAGARDHAPVGS